MSETQTQPVLHVPARDIPVPTSVSLEAQAYIASGGMPAAHWPAPEDHDAWRAFIAAAEAGMLASFEARVSGFAGTVEEIEVAGVAVYVITPEGIADDDPHVLFETHGGALTLGRGPVCRMLGIMAAERAHARTWAVDYGLPPERPYPAGLDDCVATYRALLDVRRPEDVIVCGESAGGNLAAALVLRARDEGLPLPAAALLITPQVDLTESGDSFRAGVDPTASLMSANLLYADGHDLEDPYVSPLFGDFTKGFPPTYLSAGTRDFFLSNAVRMHRALRGAGIQAELHVQEAAAHEGFGGTAPEDAEMDREVRAFVDARWGR